MKHIFSFFDNEQECISSLLTIHNEGKDIELDPMFNQGMFYKNTLNKPKIRFDINASKNGYDAKDGDATDLPLADNSVHSMILDPPFMFGTHGQTKNNVINKRYTMFNSFAELEQCYKGIIKESYRVLAKNGVLIFKCQDYTDSKTTRHLRKTHCYFFVFVKKGRKKDKHKMA